MRIIFLVSLALAVLNLGQTNLFYDHTPKEYCQKPYSTLLLGLPAEPRKVFGFKADVKDHTHVVSLIVNGTHKCGGTLIGRTAILTAAHCVNGPIATNPSQVTVRHGSSFIHKGGTVLPVAEITLHPQYSDDDVNKHDLAILKLASNVVGDHIEVIRMMHYGGPDSHDGKIGSLLGWGSSKDAGPSSPFLLQAFAPILTQAKCQLIYGLKMSANKKCAGWCGEETDFCNEDDGGPLIVEGKLVGVMSVTRRCAWPKKPALYTNIAEYEDWIRETADI